MKKEKTLKTENEAKAEQKMQPEQIKEEIIKELSSINRPGIENLLHFLEQSDYYTAPASTREDYHGAFEYGLMMHSYNVFKLFEEKNEKYKIGLPQESVALTGLLHDACKIGLYKPNILKSGKISDTKPYMCEDTVPLGHGEKSLYIIARYIELTDKEALIIRWHMGAFDPAWDHNEQCRKIEKQCPEIYAFNCADVEAAKYLD